MMKLLSGLLIPLLITLTALPSWAAIEYVGAQAAGIAGTTSPQTINFALTGGIASAPAAGDFVVVTWCTGSNADRALTIQNTGATDYTIIGSEQFANDGFATNMRTAYRFMPEPTETQVVLSSTGGGTGSTADGGTYMIFVLRGVHATPLEQAANANVAINTVIVDVGSRTPTTTGTYVYAVGCGSSNLPVVYTSSDLTDFRSVVGSDDLDSILGAGHVAWISGEVNPAAYGWDATDATTFSNAWRIVPFAPAAGGAVVTPRGTLTGVYP